MEEEGKLINEFNENEFNIKFNKKKKITRICIILAILIIIVAIILGIKYFVIDKKNPNKEPESDVKKNSNKESESDVTENPNKEFESEVEENPEIEFERDDDPYNLDIISEEELNLARNSFRQDNFTDSNKSLQYNIFIPENYPENKIYPLIIFLGDEGTIGKETNISLFKSVGGPIWATSIIQKKQKCFVLVPQYNEKLIDEKSGYPKDELVDITLNLIRSIINNYIIDTNRIYITGQSMGASTILYILSKYQDFFTASLIIESNLIFKESLHLIKTPFTYFTTSGSENALNTENIIVKYYNDSNIAYGLLNIDIHEKIEILNFKIKKLYNLGYEYNFINYKHSKSNNKNSKFFKNGYRIEATFDWLLSQNKKKCKEGFYYSDENGQCVLIISKNIKKKIFLITNHGSGDLLEKLLKKMPFVSEVRIGSPDMIPEMTESFLSLFDCIIYDLFDSGFLAKIKDIKAVERYINNNGGSFLITHDHWDRFEEYSEGLYLLGMKFDTGHNMYDTVVKKARVNHPEHPLFSSYYDLTNWGIIDILPDHSCSHYIEGNIEEKMLIEFVLDQQAKYRYDYLSVNEVGRGRIMLWSAGHSNNLSENERLLFNNIVSWLTKAGN